MTTTVQDLNAILNTINIMVKDMVLHKGDALGVHNLHMVANKIGDVIRSLETQNGKKEIPMSKQTFDMEKALEEHKKWEEKRNAERSPPKSTGPGWPGYKPYPEYPYFKPVAPYDPGMNFGPAVAGPATEPFNYKFAVAQDDQRYVDKAV